MDMVLKPLSHTPQSLGQLSAKQRECLDLVLERQTSKQIAQLLNISRHTVDQRLDSARKKLGAQTRIEAAIIYDRMRSMSDGPAIQKAFLGINDANPLLVDADSPDRFAYEPFPVGAPVHCANDGSQPNDSRLLTLEDAAQSRLLAPWEKDAVLRPFAGSLAGYSETVRRLIFIAGISLLMMAVAIVALALAESLTRLISG